MVGIVYEVNNLINFIFFSCYVFEFDVEEFMFYFDFEVENLFMINEENKLELGFLMKEI